MAPAVFRRRRCFMDRKNLISGEVSVIRNQKDTVFRLIFMNIRVHLIQTCRLGIYTTYRIFTAGTVQMRICTVQK